MRPFIPLPTHGVQKTFEDHPLYRLENNGYVMLYIDGSPVCGFDINSRLLITPYGFVIQPAARRRRVYAFAMEMGLQKKPYDPDFGTIASELSRYVAYRNFDDDYLTGEEMKYLWEHNTRRKTAWREEP